MDDDQPTTVMLQEDRQSGPSGDESGAEDEEPSTEKVEKADEGEPSTEAKYVQKLPQAL